LKDDRVLNAFRVFEEDVIVERTRRKAEMVWLDRRRDLAGKSRGAEVESALTSAWEDGKLIYFQEPDKSLHSGASLSSGQACLRIEWSDYLATMYATHVDYEKFLHTMFLPAVLSKIEATSDVFLDGILASGCLLRGSSQALIGLGVEFQNLLRQFYMDVIEGDGRGRMPTASMCMTMMGEWAVVDYEHKTLGNFRLASGLAVAQADAGISHDEGIAQIIAWRDHKAGRKALGGVRVEALDSGTGQTVSVLYNQGFALTESVLAEYLSAARTKARVKKFYLNPHKAAAIFAMFRVPGDELELVAVMPYAEEQSMLLFVKVGSPHLNGGTAVLYELLDVATEAVKLIYSEVLDAWMGA